jgi:hypothetical protein
MQYFVLRFLLHFRVKLHVVVAFCFASKQDYIKFGLKNITNQSSILYFFYFLHKLYKLQINLHTMFVVTSELRAKFEYGNFHS